MNNATEMFGCLVFNDSVMQQHLPSGVYKSLKKTMERGASLDPAIADIVASAMKDWAVSKGVTHFTHWFQPMTGVTAEKHDSFISPVSDGRIIMEFSGRELVKGEPDASSFPSGGIRLTFEARGYTAWDPTSYAFIKDGILCIPTAFCSYSGEALDKKTPLLRAITALDVQSRRILKLFGKEVKRVTSTVGSEQEYFLIERELFEKRKDLVYSGRTLFGAKPPKGQELDDHYYGAIKSRVVAYMKNLDEELWKMGVLAKTKHNEAAPCQHELASIYGTTNIAADHNQLVMETMKKIAEQHGLMCLLHEKPFAGINGSGKHNNWSLSTDKGVNLLDPGVSPEENAQFLLFLAAVVKAVDEYQDLLMVAIASAGNDHRLGANEAPPAIISVFLGDELTDIIDCLAGDYKYNKKENKYIEIGVETLPKFPRDNTDRNRTSPFAFTGNKFEFRMPGSACSISCCNYILNTIVAHSLSQMADTLENCENFNATLQTLIADTFRKHRRIIFNGNNYSDEWRKEAGRRGLLNLSSTIDALPCFVAKKNIDLMEKYRVLTEKEVRSRYEILLEGYSKTIKIEALTMIDMAKKDIIPAVTRYIKDLADAANAKLILDASFSVAYEKTTVKKLSTLVDTLFDKVTELENCLAETKKIANATDLAMYYKGTVLKIMQQLRTTADELETQTASTYWPFPTYAELFFSV